MPKDTLIEEKGYGEKPQGKSDMSKTRLKESGM